jgi:exonuclease III
VLTETWLEENIQDQYFCPHGYVAFRRNRNGNGGGVAILVRSDFVAVESLPRMVCPNLKSDFLSVCFPDLHLKVTAVYHPFWKDNQAHDKLLTCLNSIVESSSSVYSKNIFAGDLNGFVDRIDEFALVSNFSQLVNFPTRSKNILDVILTNVPDQWLNPVLLSPLATSDHAMILLESKAFTKPTTWYDFRRIFSKNNCRLLGEKLVSFDWRFLSDFDDIEDCSTEFYKILKPLVEMCFPYKKIKCRSDDKWWITPVIKSIMNEKDKAFKKKDHGQVLILQ